jgi:SulP family sulfate permease
MHAMSEVVAVDSHLALVDEDQDDFTRMPDADQRAQLPAGVEAFQISGPLFFAVANRLDDVLNQFTTAPRAFILRMRLVPLIDVSGVRALSQMIERCQRSDTRVILSGLREQPRAILAQMGLQPDGHALQFAENFSAAIQLASIPERHA